MTKRFFKEEWQIGDESIEPDFDKMLSYIEETEMEPIAKISFICKVVTARALDELSKK